MNTLEQDIRKSLEQKDILLISHSVLGYPDFKIDEASIDELVAQGTDLIELQIPFSEPQADGPFFTAANQDAVEAGTKVEECFKFAEKIAEKHPQTHFVFMTYYNILFMYGVEAFVERSAQIGMKGVIVPDLPIEESQEYRDACEKYGIAPIFMFTPTTSDERMKKIAEYAKGFVYCQARVGVTGTHTEFGVEEDKYIARCRAATDLPIAMGFGIQQKEDVDFLKGKVDIAICCTQAVKVLVNDGVEAMGDFIKKLR